MTRVQTCPNSVSAARLFLQVAAQRTSPPRFFDIFLPASTIRYFATNTNTINNTAATRRQLSTGGLRQTPPHQLQRPRGFGHRRRQHQHLPPAPPPTPTLEGILPLVAGRRQFSATATTRAHETKTLYNPQVDEDGNEMRLEITPRAAERLSQIMTKDKNPRLALRIQVESGGCHGFQYLMRLVTLPPTLPTAAAPEASSEGEQQSVVGEDDTIFYYARDSGADPLAEPKIILDQPSLELLKGSKVDFTMELIGSQFKIVDNPLATSSCGCGTSFDVKI
ncbi:hypothetical protein PpBr36_03616 [Pyricularia pennisetigena]|uniref:hypothetical protein n=1 Tax=Pyricularia pennisetigena TaxID=1578925 RepID=UPI00114E1B9E|nr:hypothetical protein PpBr36_03616 [Pyricularia pennisetigena]TLS30466.1 hypothetical protein PpBr36_03616 [Pyricularia pennisetigena]